MSEPWWEDDGVTVFHGDCIEVMRGLPAGSVDSIITDPPYELGFMGKTWDASGIAYNLDVWREALRLLKPGGHLLAFGGTRTWHRLAVAVEDAGFEIRDNIAYQHSTTVFCRCSAVPYDHETVSRKGVPGVRSDVAADDSLSSNAQQDVQQSVCGSGCQCGQEGQAHGSHQGGDSDLRGVRQRNREANGVAKARQDSDVQLSVQRQTARPGVETARGQGSSCLDATVKGQPARTHDGRKQSCLAGRGDVLAQGGQLSGDQVCASTRVGVADGSQGRLHHGASVADGDDVRSASDAAGSGEPHQPQSAGQLTDEPGVVPDERGSQTWRGWPICGRCGKPLEPPFHSGPLSWQYGSGFPKSLDVSKAIDKAAGAERGVIVGWTNKGMPSGASKAVGHGAGSEPTPITAPATPAAEQWQGWGTALKPAFEPIVVARKPLIGTVAENVQQYGTGALNIDGCRIGTDGGTTKGNPPKGESNGIYGNGINGDCDKVQLNAGRWPANVILDESQAAELDRQSGTTTSGAAGSKGSSGFADGYDGEYTIPYGDTGGASRFFYVAKANKRERPNVDGVAHPTVKPVTLMRYLVRLVTPPGGVVLDPFAGSGTTLQAAAEGGFRVIGVEKEDSYLPLIRQRFTQSFL